MAIDTVKLINYLAYGVPQTQIAAALSLSEGRISQLADQENVQELVTLRKAEIATAEATEQATIADTKALLLNKMNDLVEDVESLGEATRAYEILDKLATKGKATDGPQTREGTPGTLIVPVPIFVQQALSMEKDSKNQIIEIGQRSMATLPTKETFTLIQQTKQAREALDGQATETPDEEW